MKLSELKTGESGIIVKVQGHGGFRKRIIEMGFVKGKKVEVLQNAPLQILSNTSSWAMRFRCAIRRQT